MRRNFKVTSKYFDLGISAVIGLNVITMAMEFYMMPPVRRLIQHASSLRMPREKKCPADTINEFELHDSP